MSIPSINERIFEIVELTYNNFTINDILFKLQKQKNYTNNIFSIGYYLGILKGTSFCGNIDKETFEDTLNYLYSQKIKEYKRKRLQKSKKDQESLDLINLMIKSKNSEDILLAGLFIGIKKGFNLCGIKNYINRKKLIKEAKHEISGFLGNSKTKRNPFSL